MFALLAQRNFFLLWTAHTISILGDYVFFIAITFWVYAQTRSAAATGAVLISSTVPIPLFAPLAGVLVDRRDRRRIMQIAESARALLFLALSIILIMQPQALWPIYIVGCIQSALAAFFWPARSALLPELIQPSSLLKANAWYQVSDSGARIIAPALSAFALLRLGPAGVSLTDAASFLISAGCISLLRLALRPQAFPPQSAGISRKSARWSSIESLASAGVSGLLLLGALVSHTAGTLSILLPIFVQTTLSAGPLAYGWILTAQASGEGIISILLGRLSPRTGRLQGASVISGGFALGGLALMLIAFFHTLVSALLLSVLFGAATAAISVHLLTLLQQRAPNHLLGRTLAAFWAAQALVQVGGMAAASVLAARIGVLWLLIFDSAVYLLGGGVAWFLLTRDNNSGSSTPQSLKDFAQDARIHL